MSTADAVVKKRRAIGSKTGDNLKTWLTAKSTARRIGKGRKEIP